MHSLAAWATAALSTLCNTPSVLKVALDYKGYNNNNNNSKKYGYNNKGPTSHHSNHRCCAERRLLSAWQQQARRHGVHPHQVVTWIRRKAGADMVVWRMLKDGSLGCATPCVFCQREVLRYDLRVHCSVSHNEWYSGKLDEADAPASKPTAGQLRHLFGRQRVPTAAGMRSVGCATQGNNAVVQTRIVTTEQPPAAVLAVAATAATTTRGRKR